MTDSTSDEGMAAQHSDELTLELVRQKYGLYKVIAGTSIVGVVAAALPFVIDYARLTSQTEKDRNEFVGQYVDKALSEDIEARIRFAHYFSYVLPDRSQRDDWRSYLTSLRLEKRQVEREVAEKEEQKRRETDPDIIKRLEEEIDRLNERLLPLRRDGTDRPHYDLQMPPIGAGGTAAGREALRVALNELNRSVHEEFEYARVGEYWNSLGMKLDGRDKHAAWSGAFIAYVLSESGFDSTFPRSAANLTYWHEGVRRGWDFKASEGAPKPGGLAFFLRQGFDFGAVQQGGFVPSSAGFVYMSRPGEVDLILGNAGNAVRLVTRSLQDPKLLGFVRLGGVDDAAL